MMRESLIALVVILIVSAYLLLREVVQISGQLRPDWEDYYDYESW